MSPYVGAVVAIIATIATACGDMSGGAGVGGGCDVTDMPPYVGVVVAAVVVVVTVVCWYMGLM